MQDHLAAVFGGINTWHWEILADGLGVRRQSLAGAAGDNRLAEHFLVAYGGRPHASHDVNGVWIERFRAGRDRDRWRRIADCVRQFSAALEQGDWSTAAEAMNTETAIRRRYDQALGAYFKEESSRPQIENDIELLLEALETLDFPALRGRYRPLAGKTETPQAPLHLHDAGDFQRRVLEVVRKIPAGKVLTFDEVARAAGSPRGRGSPLR